MLLKETVKKENNWLKAKMKDQTDSYAKPAINEMKKFKTSVESISMVRFVNQKDKILDKANKLSSIVVKNLKTYKIRITLDENLCYKTTKNSD